MPNSIRDRRASIRAGRPRCAAGATAYSFSYSFARALTVASETAVTSVTNRHAVPVDRESKLHLRRHLIALGDRDPPDVVAEPG